MDGANHLIVFFRIYAPKSIPVITVIFLFSGVDHWGSWFDSIYFVKRTSLHTLAAYLVRILQRDGTWALKVADMSQLREDENWHLRDTLILRYAAIIVGILPVLLVYPLIQKYFVKG